MTYDWQRLLGRRSAKIASAPFVALDPSIDQDELIFFTGGTPPPERVPAERLAQAIGDAWAEARDTYTYGESEGYLGLRELVSHRMTSRGVNDAHPDSILITNGSQQGLDIVARILFDPGDEVIVEGPTYFGALQAFDPYEVEYLIAPMDEHGLIPDELERIAAGSSRAKAIYSVSIFQNPTGATIAQERRARILEIARRHNLIIIEDDPYGELAFGERAPNPLRADDPDVVYLGTFSKTLMPALRIGWMTLPDAIREHAINTKEAVDIQSDRFVQRGIVRAASDGWLDEHIQQSRSDYHKRCLHMISCLEAAMPEGSRWSQPEGGFFIWVDLPNDVDTEALALVAAKHGIVYLPGAFFFPDRRRTSSMRLGFTTLDREQVEIGISRLGTAIRDFAASTSPAAR